MDETQRNIRLSVQHETWADLLKDLECTYTTSFRDACRILRASRSWTNQYVKPYIPFVYINSNNRGDTRSKNINWVQMAAIHLDRPDMTESVWFHTELFNAFITAAIVSVTKQTKAIPMTYLMPKEQIEGFVAERNELRKKIREAKSILEIASLSAICRSLPCSYYCSDSATQKLLDSQVRITERTKAPAIPAPLPDGFMEKWQAPHELKDYGDADETIYRDLFRKGSIRIALQLRDEAGKVGTKIFYVPDPEPLQAPHSEEGCVIVTEQAWQQYKKKKEKQG